jgi:hypothetical protein
MQAGWIRHRDQLPLGFPVDDFQARVVCARAGEQR